MLWSALRKSWRRFCRKRAASETVLIQNRAEQSGASSCYITRLEKAGDLSTNKSFGDVLFSRLKQLKNDRE